MSGLEIAAGQMLEDGEPIRLGPPAMGPIAALERALLEALCRPPCLVAFSGGRDSSTLLAMAAAVARREGLDPPIAITQRFPHVPATDETEWQERVMGQLDVQDWIIVERERDELDIAGPVARELLARHGPVYPSNSHFAIALVEHARGGTVVTGIDGDMLFGGWRWQNIGKVRTRRARPVARDALRTAHRLSPLGVQRAVLRQRHDARPVPWLTADARRVYEERRLRNIRLQRRRYDHYVEWLAGTRHIRIARRQLDLIAEVSGARIVHPFLDRAFLAAYAASAGRHGPGTRADAMQAIFAEHVPGEVLGRTSKARFDEVYWGSHTYAFAEAWDGSGLDPDFVNADVLREEITRGAPHPTAALLVQWLVWATVQRDRS